MTEEALTRAVDALYIVGVIVLLLGVWRARRQKQD